MLLGQKGRGREDDNNGGESLTLVRREILEGRRLRSLWVIYFLFGEYTIKREEKYFKIYSKPPMFLFFIFSYYKSFRSENKALIQDLVQRWKISVLFLLLLISFKFVNKGRQNSVLNKAYVVGSLVIVLSYVTTMIPYDAEYHEFKT